MADTDILIKDLPLTETVNDSDDLVTEDSSPTTHRIKASVVKNYINAEQNDELDGLKVDLDNVNSNIGSLSSKVDDATTTVSSMQSTVNSLSNDVISINSALADIGFVRLAGTTVGGQAYIDYSLPGITSTSIFAVSRYSTSEYTSTTMIPTNSYVPSDGTLRVYFGYTPTGNTTTIQINVVYKL